MSAPTILFVCVHNAGRSQIAVAYARALGGNAVRVLSAGSEPAGSLHRVVVEAMREEGLELASMTPQLLAESDVREADIVVTMGCGDACPVYPGKRYEDWAVEDPAGQPIEAVRRIREDIRGRVERLLGSIVPDASHPSP